MLHISFLNLSWDDYYSWRRFAIWAIWFSGFDELFGSLNKALFASYPKRFQNEFPKQKHFHNHVYKVH